MVRDRRVLHVGVFSYQLMGPMLMFLIAIHEQKHEQGTPPDAPNEKIGQSTPGFSTVERGPGWNIEEYEGQGTVSGRTTEAPAEFASEGDRIDEVENDTDQQERARGEHLSVGVSAS